jgi:hypothetical protein
MTKIKNMAYWRAKNNAKSDGNYDGGDLKANRTPMKQTYDVNDTDTRVYDIDQTKYDNWRKDFSKESPDIRYLGEKENKEHLEKYLNRQKPLKKEPNKGYSNRRVGRTGLEKNPNQVKSPK